MKKANQFIFPCQFTGEYPNNWAGYTFLQWTQQGAYHPGIDWNWGSGEQDFGKPVQCIANGQVVHQSRQDGIGYGTIVVVKHELSDELIVFVKNRYNIETRNIYSFYAHLKDEIVNDNQELEIGELVGYIGKSGTSVSHLHQELYKPIPGTQWRYWPTLTQGWDQNRLKQYYIDTYDFISNQPQTIEPSQSLEECKKQVQDEIKKKQDTYNWGRELQIELEGAKSEITTYQDFQKKLAITLSTENDTAKILGAIVKLIENEDQIRKIQKELHDEQKRVEMLENELDEKDKMYLPTLAENKTLKISLSELEKANNLLVSEVNELIKQQDMRFYKLFWRVFFGSEVRKDG